MVMSHLARQALDQDCVRFEWWALKTNVNAVKFYQKFGARNLKELSIFRLDLESIQSSATGTN